LRREKVGGDAGLFRLAKENVESALTEIPFIPA
jgi:hypothetical protein